ncbi:putative transcriptional regulator, AraC family protein [Actinomadura cremea]|nr:putative transcriptional regulator, AraC family protein [Actinomadura cremea]
MSPNRQPVLRLAHREQVPRHAHPHHQVAYPSHGVLEVSTDAGTWIVPPHRAVWLPAGVAHAHRAHGPTRLRTVNFEIGEPGAGFGGPVVLAVSPLLREVIVALTGGGRDARRREHLRRVALDEIRTIEELPLHLPVPADDRLRAIADALAADPADRRTLAEFGRAAGASERTLSRLFREQMAMTFPQWRAQVRLHRALIRLAAGAPVTVVAAECGYGGPSAFIQAFRQAFGTTPARFRDARS